MTTIIVIVVVALVFFVTVCVGAFLVWKRETEMRTDSIKAIEHNLEEMLHELTQDSPPRSYAGARRRTSRNEREAAEQMLQRLREETRRAAQKRNADPFEWVRNDDGFADFSQNGRNVSGTDINQSDEELYEMAKIAGWQQREAGQPEVKPVIAEPGSETAGPLHRVLERFNETLDALKPDRVDRKRKNNGKDSPEKPAEAEAIQNADAAQSGAEPEAEENACHQHIGPHHGILPNQRGHSQHEAKQNRSRRLLQPFSAAEEKLHRPCRQNKNADGHGAVLAGIHQSTAHRRGQRHQRFRSQRKPRRHAMLVKHGDQPCQRRGKGNNLHQQHKRVVERNARQKPQKQRVHQRMPVVEFTALHLPPLIGYVIVDAAGKVCRKAAAEDSQRQSKGQHEHTNVNARPRRPSLGRAVHQQSASAVEQNADACA